MWENWMEKVWKLISKLECGPVPNVMVALPNRGGALCSTLQSLARTHCSSAVQTTRAQDLEDAKWMLHLAKFHNGARTPEKIVYQPRRWTAKHRARFGWLPLSDVAAVTLPRCETRWNLLGCPKLPDRSQPLVGRGSPYFGDMWRRYCC